MKNRRTYLLLAALAILSITAFMENSLVKSVLLLAVGTGLVVDIFVTQRKRRKDS